MIKMSERQVFCDFKEISNKVKEKTGKQVLFVNSLSSNVDFPKVEWITFHTPKEECAAIDPMLHLGRAHNASYCLSNYEQQIMDIANRNNDPFVYIYGELDIHSGVTVFIGSGLERHDGKMYTC